MPQFIVLMYQNGGCDYTIGCGRNWKFITAPTLDDAMRQVFRDGAADDSDEFFFPITLGTSGGPSEVEIFELGTDHATTSDCQEFDDRVIVAQESEDEEAAETAKEAAERAEFERLKKKFGGKHEKD